MDVTDEVFWMVWCPQGGAPTVAHGSESKAITEAGRLAQAHPGRQFYVLQATERIEVNAVRRTRLTHEMPF